MVGGELGLLSEAYLHYTQGFLHPNSSLIAVRSEDGLNHCHAHAGPKSDSGEAHSKREKDSPWMKSCERAPGRLMNGPCVPGKLRNPQAGESQQMPWFILSELFFLYHHSSPSSLPYNICPKQMGSDTVTCSLEGMFCTPGSELSFLNTKNTLHPKNPQPSWGTRQGIRLDT